MTKRNDQAAEFLHTLMQSEPRSAARLGEDLAKMLSERDLSRREGILARLAFLAAMLEANPTYFPEEMNYLRNRLASIRRQTETAEWGAALYEMRELARKLHRWGGDESVVPPAAIAEVLSAEEPRTK